MNEDKIIGKINELLDESQKLKEKPNTVEYIHKLNEVFSLVEKLSILVRNSIKNQLFREHINLGIAYYNLYDYENALKTLEDSKKLNRYKSETIDMKYTLLHLIAHIKLYLGMNSNNEKYLNEANNMINNDFNNVSKLSDTLLKEKILDDISILNAYKNNELKTIVTIEIPFPVLVNNDTYTFDFKGSKSELSFNNVSSDEESNFVELQYDKYGLRNKTKVIITMYKYFEHSIGAFEDHVNIRDYSITLLNFFIERYRIATGRYWIENINQYWITNYSFEIVAGDKVLRNCPLIEPRSYKVYSSNNPVILSDSEDNKLRQMLNFQSIELWKSMLVISKDLLLVNRYREGIFTLNCAFESLIDTVFRQILETNMGVKEASEYLNGIINYESFPLKKFISKDNFNKAIKEGLIDKKIPSTYSILKKCNKYIKTGTNNTNLTKIINEIRANRNEVIHGRDFDPKYGALNESLPNSINKFEELLSLFKIEI